MFRSQTRLPHLLRPEHYSSEAHYQAELSHVFQPAWHPIATLSELAKPGDFVTSEVCKTPLLVRNMDGVLRCFLNVCAHRHARLTSLRRGHSPTLRCQYHGWEYKSDGRTGKVPDAQSFKPWDREASCLRRFRVETWGELVFVCLADSAPSLHEFLSPVAERLGPSFEPPFEFAAAWESEFPCNWKVVIENSIESYHIPSVHPKTFKEMPPAENCSHVLDERYTTFRSAVPDNLLNRIRSFAVRRSQEVTTHLYEHDNVHPHINFVSMDDFRMLKCAHPTSRNTTRYMSIVYCLRGNGRINRALSRAIRYGVVQVTKQIYWEDAAIYRAIQQGLEASPFRGVLSAREERIHSLHQYVLARTTPQNAEQTGTDESPITDAESGKREELDSCARNLRYI